MATHSNILAWEIPWTEEPGGPQSMGVGGGQRVPHTEQVSTHSMRKEVLTHVETQIDCGDIMWSEISLSR